MEESFKLSHVDSSSNRDLPWMSIEVTADENGVTAGKQSSKWLPKRCWMMKQPNKNLAPLSFLVENAK